MPALEFRSFHSHRSCENVPKTTRLATLTSTGYVLQDGTPYDPVKRKQENERAKAMRKKLRKEHVEDEEQEATVADEEEEDDVEDDVEDEEDETCERRHPAIPHGGEVLTVHWVIAKAMRPCQREPPEESKHIRALGFRGQLRVGAARLLLLLPFPLPLDLAPALGRCQRARRCPRAASAAAAAPAAAAAAAPAAAPRAPAAAAAAQLSNEKRMTSLWKPMLSRLESRFEKRTRIRAFC
jgi:hypothetical protein